MKANETKGRFMLDLELKNLIMSFEFGKGCLCSDTISSEPVNVGTFLVHGAFPLDKISIQKPSRSLKTKWKGRWTPGDFMIPIIERTNGEPGCYFIVQKENNSHQLREEIILNINLNNRLTLLKGKWPPLGKASPNYYQLVESGQVERFDLGGVAIGNTGYPEACLGAAKEGVKRAKGNRILKIGLACGGGGINKRIHGYQAMQKAITRYILGTEIHKYVELFFVISNDAGSAKSLERNAKLVYQELKSCLPPWEQVNVRERRV